MDKKINLILCSALAFSMFSTGCTENQINDAKSSSESVENADNTSNLSDSDDYDSLFSERDLSGDFDEPDAEIHFDGDKITVEGDKVEVDKTTIKINQGGVYRFSGKLENGKIVVDSGKNDKVQLVFDSVDLTCSDSSPLCILSADKTFLTLAENSVNILTDGENYCSSDAENSPDSVIFSKDDLTVNGSGSLVVNGNFNEGITCKNDLVIVKSDITVNAVGNGIKGVDSIAVKDAKLDITSNSDGLKSDNADDLSKGFIYLCDSVIKICADEDGVQAETDLICNGDNDIQITAGGGFTANTDSHNDEFGGGFGGRRDLGGQNERDMPKGGVIPDSEGRIADYKPPVFEGDNQQSFNGEAPPDFNGEMPERPDDVPPDFNGEMPERPDDMPPQQAENNAESGENEVSTKGIKAGNLIEINGGKLEINACDDAVHSNGTVNIKSGEILLSAGDDGIHADKSVDISDGEIDVITSYEGIEAAYISISGGTVSVAASDDGLNASDGTQQVGMGTECDADITVSGGILNITADGDGIDSNGTIHIFGGTVNVYGPTNDGNSAIDGNGDILIDGGKLAAFGSSGMLEIPSDTSKQNFVVICLAEYADSDSEITIFDENSECIFSGKSPKKFDSVIVGTSDLQMNSTYTVKLNDVEIDSFTVESTASNVGNMRNFGGGQGRGGMPPRR